MTQAMPFDRLVAKETALGALRDMPVPNEHIGVTQIAPMEDVGSDDVIFNYIQDNLTEGLAPARAQDAEAELAQKDESGVTSGRARLIDWSLKNTYDASKVKNYKDMLAAQRAMEGANVTGLNSTVFNSPIVEFRNKIARDDAWRKSRLDNRLEWLVMTGFEQSRIDYDDGKVNFSVNYNRPAAQQDVPVDVPWSDPDADPIGNLLDMNRYMFDTYGIEMKDAYCSKYILRDLFKLDRFKYAAAGVVVGGVPNFPLDIPYIRPDWNEQKAIDIIQQATGITFHPYDGFYRSRPLGSNQFTNVRYTSSKKITFRPAESDLAQVDPDGMGFAKTLTSPHPEGNWTPGWYEWEKDRTDPWGTDRGTGIMAFPVFFFMKYSYCMQVLPS